MTNCMKKQYLATLLLCVAIVGLQTVEAWRTPSRLEDRVKVHDSWRKFKAHFKRTHATQEEEKERFELFSDRYQSILEHNIKYERGEVSYKQGINELSDWTHLELRRLRGPKKMRTVPKERLDEDSLQLNGYVLPPLVNYTAWGAVSPAKVVTGLAQSSYAYSAIDCLETLYAMVNRKLYTFSAQHVLDCGRSYGYLYGIFGGDPRAVFAYYGAWNTFIPLETTYPTNGANKTCTFDKATMPSIPLQLNDWKSVSGTEGVLKTLVATNGPVAVHIDADFPGFASYQSGVYDHQSCDGSYADLYQTVIGYGTDKASGKDFWLLKGVFGPSWGESGFMKFLRGKNQCNIASTLYYATM